MKIVAAAVVAVSALPYSSAFVGPQAASRTLQASSLNLQKTPSENNDAAAWVGSAATVVAGLTLASQSVGAAVPVDVPMPTSATVVEASNGTDHKETLQGKTSLLVQMNKVLWLFPDLAKTNSFLLSLVCCLCSSSHFHCLPVSFVSCRPRFRCNNGCRTNATVCHFFVQYHFRK